jgi:hypothetical protein
MTLIRTWEGFRVAIVGLAIVASGKAAAQVANGTSSNHTAEQARIALSHTLAHLDGAHLKATVVEITYGPSESSQPHSHPCPVIGYVIQGSTSDTSERQGLSTKRARVSTKRPTAFNDFSQCDQQSSSEVSRVLCL